MEKLAVEVWSDIACPWCYVGKRRLEAALARFPHREHVEVVWRSFELDTSAPRVRPAETSYAESLAEKYGLTVAKAEGMLRSMTATAAADGLDFHFETIRPGNTFDAHRLLHLATQRGLQGKLKERLMRAYFTEGEAIGDVDTLVRLGEEIGLDAEEARSALASKEWSRQVRADEAKAQAMGVTGVPFFAVAGRYGVSGAQPPEMLLEVLDRAWNETAPSAEDTESPGAACGPDGCDDPGGGLTRLRHGDCLT